MDAEHIGRDQVATERLAHLRADAEAVAGDAELAKRRTIRPGSAEAWRNRERRASAKRDAAWREACQNYRDADAERARRHRETSSAWPPLSRSQVARRRRRVNRERGRR